MKSKKVIVMAMVITCILSIGTSTLALEAKEPKINEAKISDNTILWDNTQTVSFGLNRTTGTCNVQINGNSSVTKRMTAR